MNCNGEFYSNCLIESVKAKLKNPKNVKIHIMFDFKLSIIPHFWWEKNNIAYNFTSLKKRRLQVIFFKGKIIERNLKSFQTYSDAQNNHIKFILTKPFHKNCHKDIEIVLD